MSDHTEPVDTVQPLTAERVALTMADIRRRVTQAMALPPAAFRRAQDEVSRGTVPFFSERAEAHKRGSGVDWSDAEKALAIRLRAAGLKVPAMMRHLPGRSEQAIRQKLARLGVSVQPPRSKRRVKRRGRRHG